jgi:hypothetical protein
MAHHSHTQTRDPGGRFAVETVRASTSVTKPHHTALVAALSPAHESRAPRPHAGETGRQFAADVEREGVQNWSLYGVRQPAQPIVSAHERHKAELSLDPPGRPGMYIPTEGDRDG